LKKRHTNIVLPTETHAQRIIKSKITTKKMEPFK